MSAVTVTYQELPPMASWVSEAQHHHLHHHHQGGHHQMDDSPLMHFGDHVRSNQNGNWNSFCMEESKCDPVHTTNGAMESHGDWLHHHHQHHQQHLNSPTLSDATSVAQAQPPPPSSYHTMTPTGGGMYNGSEGPPASVQAPYQYDCAPGAVKNKRFSSSSNLRTSASSPGVTAVPTGLAIGIGGGNGMGGGMAPEELCLVCGDKASGYHYNALTCEGCKGFFRRSITRKAMYYCKYGGHCDIDMYMRRKCQACRLRKCLDIGMRPELVIPEEQCRLKRESKNKMRTANGTANVPTNGQSNNQTTSNDDRKSNSPQQVTSTDSISPNPPMMGLTPEQRELVHRLIRYQEQYEMPSDEELTKLSAFRNEQQPSQQQGHTHFQHLAELTILNVQLIVEFTKHLPGFLTLNKDDQLTLLKACSTEILMLKTARRYDQKTDTIVLGNRTTSWAYSRDAYKQAGMGSATDAIFEFAKSMARLRVDPAEFALLTAISIFSERPGLSEPRKVEDIQEVYTSTLQAYIDAHRPKNRTVFARLLMKLTDLRTLGCEQADVLFSLKSGHPPYGHHQQRRESGDEDNDEQSAAMLMTQIIATTPTRASIGEMIEGPAAANGGSNVQQPQRVPNVRIKVEPLAGGGGSSNNLLMQFNNGNRDELAQFECHSTLFVQSRGIDDVNNNNQRYQLDETQQTVTSSNGFAVDGTPKWN